MLSVKRRVFLPLSYLKPLLRHIYKCWLNNRTLGETLAVLAKTLSPLVAWLLLFNTINLIPNHLKPQINVRLVMRLDQYVFESVEGGIMTLVCLMLGGYLLIQLYYGMPNTRFSDVESHKKLFDKAVSLWDKLPVYLVVCSWGILAVVYCFREPINKVNNIVALVFYVIGHVLIVPCSIWYFYLFHSPKVLRLFLLILGVQNIMINLTHLVFPNVPPIYIQYYGENKNATYDLPGYSEGLTRIDLNFPFNEVLNFFILYVKSIEFGILPSLHLSMSLTIVYFCMNLLKSGLIKLVLLVYCIFQIWSLIYLQHHWRIDIVFSFVYSSLFFLMAKDKLVGIKQQFRQDVKFGNDATMGMRLFAGTVLESVFNPQY